MPPLAPLEIPLLLPEKLLPVLLPLFKPQGDTPLTPAFSCAEEEAAEFPGAGEPEEPELMPAEYPEAYPEDRPLNQPKGPKGPKGPKILKARFPKKPLLFGTACAAVACCCCSCC